MDGGLLAADGARHRRPGGLGAVGIVLPALTGILPWLTPLAALGLVLTMLGAARTHLRRAERGSSAVLAVLPLLAAVVTCGRCFARPA